MKTVITTTLLLSALAATTPAIAGENNWTGKKAKTQCESYQTLHKNEYRKSNKHNYRNKPAHRDVIRLDIPVAVRGNDRVHLRRLVNRHSNVNLDHYRLKKVVVSNYARRQASARLIVGNNVSDVYALRRGRNHIDAPHRSDGRWVLGVKDARIDNIRVVLEPKQYAFSGRDKNRQPWFADSRRWH